MADVLQQQEDSADLLDARALFRGDDKRIYRMHFLEKLTQEEIAAALNRSQSYVSKRLAKIKETLESTSLQHDRSKKEAYAERQWEQFLEKFRTENDEDILFDLFRCVCGSDLQEAFLEWFYSYREYSKFCLQYLILRPFDNASDEEFKQRLNRLSEWQRLTYRLQFAEQLEEVRWLYIALCEKMNERQEKLQTPPSHPDEKRNTSTGAFSPNFTNGWGSGMRTFAASIRISPSSRKTTRALSANRSSLSSAKAPSPASAIPNLRIKTARRALK